MFAVGLHTCTAVARSLCVSWAFLYILVNCNIISDMHVKITSLTYQKLEPFKLRVIRHRYVNDENVERFIIRNTNVNGVIFHPPGTLALGHVPP